MVRCYASRGAPSPGTLDGCADYKPPPPNLHSSLRPHILPPHDGDKLYDLLRDLWDLLDALRMEYWVTGATLLGLCRHGGQIPWHASAAVAVGPLDSPRLDKELEEIKQEGNWTFETVEGCIRCRKVEQPWPFIDVYATELYIKDDVDVTQSEDNDADHLAEIRYASEAARKKRPDDAWRISKLYPLKACTFRGSARCRSRPPAPHDSRDWLARVYGKAWKTTARPPSINYRTQKRNEVVEVPLLESDRVPLGHPSLSADALPPPAPNLRY